MMTISAVNLVGSGSPGSPMTMRPAGALKRVSTKRRVSRSVAQRSSSSTRR